MPRSGKISCPTIGTARGDGLSTVVPAGVICPPGGPPPPGGVVTSHIMAEEASGVPKGKLYVAFWLVLLGMVVFWGSMAFGVGRRTFGVMAPIGLWGIGILIIVVLLALAGREIISHGTYLSVKTVDHS